MSFFRNVRKMIGNRANNMRRPRGMFAGLAGLRDRMRNPRMPLMGGMRDISPLSRQPLRRMLPIMDIDRLPPQPGGNRKFLDMLGGGALSDIMPKEPPFGYHYKKPPALMPDVQGPYRTSPVLDIPPGMQTQIQPQPTGPVNPSLLKPPSYEPPKEDFSGYLDFYRNRPVPGMKAGGEMNAGLMALAQERPDVVKKILGKQAGGEISLFEIVSRLQKSMGSLSKNELDLLKDMYSDGRFSAGDMMQKVKDFRAGKFMPRKFEDLETKTNRLSKTMGTGEAARGANKNKQMLEMFKRLQPSKEMIQGGLKSLTRLPKFSIPSALAGFGAGYLLDNMFEGEPEEDNTPVMPRGESMELPPRDRERFSRQLDALNVGRTISEQDRQIVEDLLGVTNARTLSDRDVYYVLQSIQNNPGFQAEINDLMEE